MSAEAQGSQGPPAAERAGAPPVAPHAGRVSEQAAPEDADDEGPPEEPASTADHPPAPAAPMAPADPDPWLVDALRALAPARRAELQALLGSIEAVGKAADELVQGGVNGAEVREALVMGLEVTLGPRAARALALPTETARELVGRVQCLLALSAPAP